MSVSLAFKLLNVSESVANGAKFSSGREGGTWGRCHLFLIGRGEGGWLQEFDAVILIHDRSVDR